MQKAKRYTDEFGVLGMALVLMTLTMTKTLIAVINDQERLPDFNKKCHDYLECVSFNTYCRRRSTFFRSLNTISSEINEIIEKSDLIWSFFFDASNHKQIGSIWESINLARAGFMVGLLSSQVLLTPPNAIGFNFG